MLREPGYSLGVRCSMTAAITSRGLYRSLLRATQRIGGALRSPSLLLALLLLLILVIVVLLFDCDLELESESVTVAVEEAEALLSFLSHT